MRINTKKYIEEAHKRGISPVRFACSLSKSYSVSVFNGEVEEQHIGEVGGVGGKGLVDGKYGSFSADGIREDSPSLLADKILENAKYGKEGKTSDFYSGGKRYRKVAIDEKAFVPSTLQELREAALALEKEVHAKDSRIKKCSVDLAFTKGESMRFNDVGLKCSKKTFYYLCNISLVCEDEKGEPRTAGNTVYSFTTLADVLAKARKEIDKTIHQAVDFFGSGPVKGKDYKTVLSPDLVSCLLPYFLDQLDAKKVEKHLSLFEGKKGTQVMSSKITLLHTPHIPSLSSASYDSSGVPTEDFPIVKRGVLMNYAYSLESANEEKIEPNGCGAGNGYASFFTVTVKPGKESKEQLFAKVKDGIYLTSVSGLNTGIDSASLSFSLPCSGYLIKDGKKAEAFSMMIVSGNIKELFENVVALGNDVEDEVSLFTPSMVVKKLHYSGK